MLKGDWGIQAIHSHLGDGVLTNGKLALDRPEWDMEQAQLRTGVTERRIAKDGQTAFDLSVLAVDGLLSTVKLDRDQLQGIIVCTSTPDFIMPGNSFLLHGHLNLRQECVALDVNLSCSGFPYLLPIANGFMSGSNADNFILVTGDTFSRIIAEDDRSTRVLFGDGVTATLLSRREKTIRYLGGLFYSSGKDAGRFTVKSGGQRWPTGESPRDGKIAMDGLGILSFFSTVLPSAISKTLSDFDLSFEDICYVIPHQASKLAIDNLLNQHKGYEDKFVVDFEKCGNLTSASIPHTLSNLMKKNVLRPKDRILLVGFGVGLSWSTAILEVC